MHSYCFEDRDSKNQVAFLKKKNKCMREFLGVLHSNSAYLKTAKTFSESRLKFQLRLAFLHISISQIYFFANVYNWHGNVITKKHITFRIYFLNSLII